MKIDKCIHHIFRIQFHPGYNFLYIVIEKKNSFLIHASNLNFFSKGE